jgi:hypothetical protein
MHINLLLLFNVIIKRGILNISDIIGGCCLKRLRTAELEHLENIC